LELCSFVDPETQLFNRRYLDQLFNQQLKWLNRSGKPATLLLFEVLPKGQIASTDAIAICAALVLRSNFRGSDFIVRNANYQFLVLLPDTTEGQAQFALNRLTDKVENWNLENEKSEMVLRHELSACPPGSNFWEILRKMEDGLKGKPDPPIDHAYPVEVCKETVPMVI
jgi:diguanylate cyclase (GGDEF)-like protein